MSRKQSLNRRDYVVKEYCYSTSTWLLIVKIRSLGMRKISLCGVNFAQTSLFFYRNEDIFLRNSGCEFYWEVQEPPYFLRTHVENSLFVSCTDLAVFYQKSCEILWSRVLMGDTGTSVPRTGNSSLLGDILLRDDKVENRNDSNPPLLIVCCCCGSPLLFSFVL